MQQRVKHIPYKTLFTRNYDEINAKDPMYKTNNINKNDKPPRNTDTTTSSKTNSSQRLIRRSSTLPTRSRKPSPDRLSRSRSYHQLYGNRDKDGHLYPVCSRFPKCGVCVVDIEKLEKVDNCLFQ